MLTNTVRSRRVAAGIGFRQLARATGLDPKTLWRLERQAGTCSDEAKVAVARALGCSVMDCFFAEAVA